MRHKHTCASDASYSYSFQSYTSANQSRLHWQMNGSEICVGPSHKAFKACHTTSPVGLSVMHPRSRTMTKSCGHLLSLHRCMMRLKLLPPSLSVVDKAGSSAQIIFRFCALEDFDFGSSSSCMPAARSTMPCLLAVASALCLRGVFCSTCCSFVSTVHVARHAR